MTNGGRWVLTAIVGVAVAAILTAPLLHGFTQGLQGSLHVGRQAHRTRLDPQRGVLGDEDDVAVAKLADAASGADRKSGSREPVAVLASDEARWVIGTTIVVDGGYLAE